MRFLGLMAILIISILVMLPMNMVEAGDDGLYIVTSFAFLGDIVSNILGDAGRVDSLVLPDKHVATYEIVPRDSEKIWLSDIFLYIGYGAEEAIGQYAIAIKDGNDVYSVKELLRMDIPEIDVNPYFWMDPLNVVKLVERLTSLFIEYDPENSEIYISNSEKYISQLMDLDSWIRDLVSEIPSDDRKLFTVRNTLKYFAERYGFEVAGYVTASAGFYEPSTSWVVQKFEDILSDGVTILFIEFSERGTTLREVIETMAEEAGIEAVGFLYVETISPSNGVESYIEMMRVNTELIVETLKERVASVDRGAYNPIFDNPILRPFKYWFLVRGFITLILIMAVTSLVGSFAVLRGWSIFSDALGHGAIVGLLMAYLLSMDFYLGALLIGLFIAFSVGTIERVTRLRADVVIALTFTTMLAIAIIIISSIGGVNISLEDVLFADVTAISVDMMWRAIISASAIGGFVILFRRQLLLYSIDPLGSISLGVKVGTIHYLFLILLAITTVSAFMSIGAIPAIASIIVPPASAYLVSRRPKQFMLLSLIIGVFSGVFGFYISYYYNVNAGAATIMVSVLAFLIAVAIHVYRKPPTPEISR